MGNAPRARATAAAAKATRQRLAVSALVTGVKMPRAIFGKSQSDASRVFPAANSWLLTTALAEATWAFRVYSCQGGGIFHSLFCAFADAFATLVWRDVVLQR